jgi:hypothetical protein
MPGLSVAVDGQPRSSAEQNDESVRAFIWARRVSPTHLGALSRRSETVRAQKRE